LYELVKYGTIVEVYGGPFGPFGRGFRKLYPGDSGSDVMEVQKYLKLKGYYRGYLSGYYSVDMEKALNEFQKDNNILINNIIDGKMYEKLGIVLAE
jgi:peptidoglycan hydrolase-like protein with peptidoglycan-binding domain